MKKFLLFMLLFVNLQIVMTKCGVEIGIQSAMAQDSGKESSIVGKYSCEAIDEMGNPMIVYTDLPCQYLDDRKCSNCGRLFSTLGERKTHEASCGSQQENKEKKKKEEEELEKKLRLFDEGTTIPRNLSNTIGNLSGVLAEYEKLSGIVDAGFENNCVSYAFGLLNVAYQTYKGYQQDKIEGNSIPWNAIDGGVSSGLGMYTGQLGAAMGVTMGAPAGPEASIGAGLLMGYGASYVGEQTGHVAVDVAHAIYDSVTSNGK